MRFGGHETFVVREGWLYKGLDLLNKQPDRYVDPLVADWLGVGRNMAKSIKHWLTVTGLVMPPRRAADKDNEITQIGRLIMKYDKYMLDTATWWILHINLVTQSRDAIIWPWFFNAFSLERFDRTHCADQFLRYSEVNNLKSVNPKTVQKDLLCLLSSYGRPIPAEKQDPEDTKESPFRDLGLLVHFRDTDTYQIQRDRKDIPPEILLHLLSVTFGGHATDSGDAIVKVRDALTLPRSPGRVFALGSDGLVDLAESASEALGEESISIRSLAGERVIRFRPRTGFGWLEQYYQR